MEFNVTDLDQSSHAEENRKAREKFFSEETKEEAVKKVGFKEKTEVLSYDDQEEIKRKSGEFEGLDEKELDDEIANKEGKLIKVSVTKESIDNAAEEAKQISLEDPDLVKAALSNFRDNVEDTSELPKETLENTRRNSITMHMAQPELDIDTDDELATASKPPAKKKLSRTSTLPSDFRNAFKSIPNKSGTLLNRLKQMKDDGKKLAKKPSDKEKTTVTSTNSIKIPTKSDVNKKMKNLRQSFSKNINIKVGEKQEKPGTNYNAKRSATIHGTLPRLKKRPVEASKYGSDQAVFEQETPISRRKRIIAMHSDDLGEALGKDSVDPIYENQEQIRCQSANNLEVADEGMIEPTVHARVKPLVQRNNGYSVSANVVSKRASTLPKKIPPPRPSEAPVSTPFDDMPIINCSQEQMVAASPSELSSSQSDYENVRRSNKTRPERPKSQPVFDKRSSALYTISDEQENDENINPCEVSDLNPIQFQHNAIYSSTMNRPKKMYRTRSDMESEEFKNKYKTMIEKRRTKNLSTSSEPKDEVVKIRKPPKQMEVYERQEVYSFSFRKKKPQIKRCHTSVYQTDNAVQPLVARPKLEATLRAVIDPKNKHLLDPNAKTMTLGRTGTLPRPNSVRSSSTLSRPPKIRSATLQRPVSLAASSHVKQSRPIRPPSIEVTMNSTEKANGSVDTSKLCDVKLPLYAAALHKEMNMNGDASAATLSEQDISKMGMFMTIKKYDEDIYADMDDQVRREKALACFEAYLSANEKLNAADLQGEYSAFSWRMGDMNPNMWEIQGCVKGWSDLVLIRDNSLTIDYVRLPKKSGSLVYPNYSIDCMLQNWLDRKSTIPRSGGGKSVGPNGSAPDVMHTVSLLSTLESLMAHLGDSSATSHTCMALGLLLSLNYCLESSPNGLKLSLTPEDVLMVSTSTNCLMLFKVLEANENTRPFTLYATDQSAPEMQELMKQLATLMAPFDIEICDTLQATIERVVAILGRQLNNLLIHDDNFSAKLLKSLTPPDWTVLAISRIGLSKL